MASNKTENLNKGEIYLVELRRNNELNLEHIDQEVRMEQVRQTAMKMEWASFGQAVRRNLLEKRYTLDPESRKDVLRGLAFMRSKMPIDAACSIKEKFRIMSESLGCSNTTTPQGWTLSKEELTMEFTMNENEVSEVTIRLWDEPPFVSKIALNMLKNGKWTDFRNRIAGVLSTYETAIVGDERIICKGAMKMLELLFSKYSTESRYTEISRANYGYYLPSHDLRRGRLYYLVEPHFRNMKAKERKYHLQKSDYDILPFIEFTFIKHSGLSRLPCYNSEGTWSDTVKANVTIRLKLSKGFLMSEQTRLKLGAISSKTALIKHYTNCYRFMLGEIVLDKDLQMITQFPDGVQHYYTIEADSFANDGDVVITEIYLKSLQDFHEVIAILRNEWMHISLWESMMAACYEKQGLPDKTIPAIKMSVLLSRSEFRFSFDTLYGPIKLYIREGGALEFKVNVVNGETGEQIAERIDEILSRKLNDTWSIPATLTFAVSGEDCNLDQIKVPLRKENPETRAPTPPPRPTRRPRR